MKTLLILLFSISTQAQTANDAVKQLAFKNGFKPSDRIVNAIVMASQTFHINPLELTAICLIETGCGKYNQINHNRNKSIDVGIFQINSINHDYCIEYNLQSPEGSALCAAKLLSRIQKSWQKKDAKWLGRYHSKTIKYKNEYYNKINKVIYANL